MRVMKILIALFSFLILTSAAEAQTFSGECLHTWTIAPDRATLRDGVHVGGGYGDRYQCVNGFTVYVQAGPTWYVWGGSSWSPVSNTDPGGVPQPWVAGSSTGSLTLAWDANIATDAVTEYQVNIGTIPGASTQNIPVGLATSYVFSTGVVNQNYCFTVQAKNANGVSPPSQEVCGIFGSGAKLLIPPAVIRVQ